VVSFIVPDSFLLGRYFSKIREYILSECAIHYLLLIKGRVFDNVTVGQSAIFLFQKTKNTPGQSTRIILGSEKYFLGNGDIYSYCKCYFKKMERNRFRLLFDSKTKTIVEKLEDASFVKPLKSFIDFQSGLIAKNGQKSIKSNTKINCKYGKGIFSGGCVHRFFVDYKNEFLCFDPVAIKSGGVNTVSYFKPKLFVRQTGDCIICAFDGDGLLALNNVHIGNKTPNSTESLKYILACLNSKIVDFYYKAISLEDGRPMAQVDIDILASLPIPVTTVSRKGKIEALVECILSAKQADPAADTTKLEDEIDELVYDLYGLTLEEIEFVKDSVNKSGNNAGYYDEDDAEETKVVTITELKNKTANKHKISLPPALSDWD
jgi:adenine-specific DNA-methyltransferase